MGFSDLLSALSEDERLRGQQFERICCWYLRNAPEYRSQVRRVWLWNDWPHRWGPDVGIDLVAETITGDLWGIQAKAYAPENSLTKREIDSFLTESNRAEFAFRLLIATTDRISANARRALAGQEKPVGVLLRSQLATAPVVWPASPDELVVPLRPSVAPRDHQEEAIAAVLGGFEGADRGQLIMACGTGKTLAGMWITQRLPAKRTLVLVPSLSLLAQTLREWTANTSEAFSYLAVCSDRTVVAEQDADTMVEHPSELGFPVTTDPVTIARFLRGRGGRVVFATYQSSPQIAAAFASPRLPAFDLAIADEAHRCVGPFSSEFATILDPHAIRSKRRLFMTATPRFFTRRVRRAAAAADYEVASMDDLKRFGPEFYRLTFAEAIERQLLSDYRVLVVVVDDPTYQDYAEHGQLVTFGSERISDARTLAAHIGLAKATRRYDLRRTITFHGRVAKARAFSREFPTVVAWIPASERPEGPIVSSYVSGAMPAGLRAARLDQLRHLESGERGLLANARCLAEGVDVPTLDGIAFIDPRRSQVDIVQAVGRVMRLAPDKDLGTIVLPVFVETATDPEEAIKASALEPVWSVLRALRAHDETLAEELDELRRQLGRRGVSGTRPGKIVLDVPVSVGPSFAKAFDTRLVERTTSSWEFMFGHLLAFVERDGHARVPVQFTVDGANLGFWVVTQRAFHTRGILDPQRAHRLETLPGWVWDAREDRWERAYSALQEFARAHGHARVPGNFVAEGIQLGSWVVTQRVFHARGALDPERVRRLEAVPGWTWDVGRDQWERTFAALEDYAREYGHARVPTDFAADGIKLGSWVHLQRNLQRRGRLDPKRARRLEALPGWAWDALEDRWEKAFSALDGFVGSRGHAQVPRDLVIDGVTLGTWVVLQRIARKDGRLDPERIRRLEALPGWTWDPREARWEVGFAALERFAREHGHTQVTRDVVVDGVKLGGWVNKQRHRESLTAEQTRRLEALPGWSWDPHEDWWEQAFAALKRFVEANGHARVPQQYTVDGIRLGTWVSGQRAARKKGTVTPERERRLEELAGWVWNERDARWETAFAALEEYVVAHGDARPRAGFTEGGLRLGSWVSVQRAAHKSGTLSPERTRRLEALPGWTWDARLASDNAG